MIIIDRKDEENVDRMIRRYRRKHRDTQLLRQLRSRKEFTKPSVKRRKEILKAIYKREKTAAEEL
jgi:small subunit ribosomal protein S21